MRASLVEYLSLIRFSALPEDQGRPLPGNLEDRLAEQGIRPGEPGPRVILDVIDIDGLMDEAQQARVANKLQTSHDFTVIEAGDCLDEEGHGPCVSKTNCVLSLSVEGLRRGRVRDG